MYRGLEHSIGTSLKRITADSEPHHQIRNFVLFCNTCVFFCFWIQMASKQIAHVLQKKFGRFATVLIYAVLEWVLILLLLIGALLFYLATKFAEYFGLPPPCPWCSRIDHILGNGEPAFYTKFVCDLHVREISSLGYCHVHKKLSDIQGMCEDCLLSFAT